MEEHRQGPSVRAVVARIVKPLVVALVVVALIKLFVLEAYRIPSGSMERTLVPGDFVLVNKLAFGLRTPAEIPVVGLRTSALTLVPGKDVRRGDVVVFSFSKAVPGSALPRGAKLVKRVVGLPGDTVLVAGSDIRINGQSLRVSDPTRMMPQRRASRQARWSGPVVVPRQGQRIDLSGEHLARWADIIRDEGHEVALSYDGRILIDGESREEYTVERNYYYVLGDNLNNSFDSRYWGFVSDRDLIGEVLMIYWSWRPGSSSEVLSAIPSIRWERIGSLVQ
jgi:signal peptidase I